jgi:hypothetical protein
MPLALNPGEIGKISSMELGIESHGTWRVEAKTTMRVRNSASDITNARVL